MWEFCEACLAIHLCHAHVNHWSGSKPTNRNRWSVKSSSPPDDPKHLSYVSDMDLKRLYGTYPSVSAIVWKSFVSASLYWVSEPVTETSPIAYACWTHTAGLWNIPLKRRGTKYDSYCAQYKHLAKRTDFSYSTGSQGPVWTVGGLLPCSCKSWKFERWILAYTGVEFKGVSSITSSISALKSGLGMCLYHWCALVLLVPWEYDPVCLAGSEGSVGVSLLTPAHLSWHSIP